MKKLNYIAGLFLMTFSMSCESNLDVNPVASIDAEDAIVDASGLNSALMGLYNEFQSDAYYGRDLYILGELSANDGRRTGTSLDYQQFENHSILSDNASVESLWSQAYSAINNANNIIERGALIEMDEAQKNNALGEAYFLRALAHFDLLKLFGGVPLKIKSTQGVMDDVNTPRSTVEEVYNAVLQDLNRAAENISLDKGNYFVSQAAVIALQSRIEMYYGNYLQNTNQEGTSHFQNALNYANQIIESGEFAIEEDFSNVFLQDENTEVIFQLSFSSQDRNRMSYYLSPVSLGGRGEVSYTNGLANSYKRDDLRSAFIFQDFPTLDGSGTSKTVAKYQDSASGADAIIILRLAELYLIKAECLYNINGLGAQTEILDAINSVRNRAITPLTALGSDPIATILEERRWELCFEGHRWSDLVRTNKASSTLGISQNATLYPIPLVEIQTNTNISVSDQNPGY